MNGDINDDPITAALSSRRIPHSRSGKKAHGGGRTGGSRGHQGQGHASGSFNPLRALGRYAIDLGSSAKRARKKGSGGGVSSYSSTPDSTLNSWLEIHEFTPNEDGFVGTFEFYGVGSTDESGSGGGDKNGSEGVGWKQSSGKVRVSGMCVLAGSRKGLATITEDMERDGESEHSPQNQKLDQPGSADEDDEGGEQSDENNDRDEKNDEDEDNDENEEENHDDDNDDDDGHAQTSLEAQDARMNKRARAFEKNTFRNPKFWMRWKAHVQHQDPITTTTNTTTTTTTITTTAGTSPNVLSEHERPLTPTPSPKPTLELGSGYLIFSGNDCARFDGTVSCAALGWDNYKVHGRKVHSKSTACPVRWTDLDLDLDLD